MKHLHLLSPLGFRAGAVYAGIKRKKQADVGLLVCDHLATAAAVFTTNRVFAAPIKVGREYIAAGKLCAVVVNSGNANACTGRQGDKDARRMSAVAAELIGCKPKQVLPSSTGIIGRPLPMDHVEIGIRGAAANLGSDRIHAEHFNEAILTTDLVQKHAAATVRIGQNEVIIAGVCKGSGMIGPRMALPGRALHATMLAYLTTDAAIPAPLLRRLLAEACDLSFNAVTVDDHTSTNDTACIMASGQSKAAITSAADIKNFGAALNEVCGSLAYKIAADGEGATKVVIVNVRQAKTKAAAQAIARAIANSPLVKCAMHGNDPNWGRIISAAGFAGVPFDPGCCVLKVQGIPMFRAGQPSKFDPAQVSRALHAKEVVVDLDCRQGISDAKLWTCDLSKGYITINADYHT
jgi:glutamate N-acetyltransferase/amino-acid N-acetyltransferase